LEEKKLTASEVRAWLSQVDADLKRVAGRLEPLLTEQRGLDERKMLLQSLLRSFDSAGANGAASPSGSRPSGSVARYVIDRAVEILRDEGGPLHINDLHARFLERGFTVPGAGKPVNLTVHVREAEEIASPMRGVYGLTGQVGAIPRPAAPRRRRRRTRARAQGRKS
jgi:hypothetical protein